MNKKRYLYVALAMSMIITQVSASLSTVSAVNDISNLKNEISLLTTSVDGISWLNKGLKVVGTTGVLLVDVEESELATAEKTDLSGKTIYEVSTSVKPGETEFNLGDRTITVKELKGEDAEAGIGVSNPIKSIIDVKDSYAYVDETNKNIISNIDIGTPSNPIDLIDNDTTTGASYYNMMTFYGQVYQVNEAIGSLDNASIYNINTKAVINKTYVSDLLELVKKINDFDPTLKLTYDESKTSLNCIAENGIAKLTFHIQTNGYWGYGVGRDSIIDKVLDVPGGYSQNNATLAAKGKFFNIDYGNGIHVLRDVDLQNPVLIMNDTEALLIDVDFNGSEIMRSYIKEIIGDRELSIYITHNHTDHVNNLDCFEPDDIETLYYPENETYNSGRLSKFSEKVELVEDGQILNIAGKQFEVIEMLGHTVGGTQLLDITDKILFSGDTLGAQTFRGGTVININAIETWKNEVEKNIKRLKVDTNDCKFDYIIGGHTAYKTSQEFINNLYLCIMEAYTKGMSAITTVPSGNTIVVNDGKVLTSSQIQALWDKLPTDEEMVKMCSIRLNQSSDTAVFQENESEYTVVMGTQSALLIDGTVADLSEEMLNRIGTRNIIEVTTKTMPTSPTFDLGGITIKAVKSSVEDAQNAIGYTDAIRDSINVEDTIIYVDETNRRVISHKDIGNLLVSKELTDNDFTTGASYYNMMKYYTEVKQVYNVASEFENPAIFTLAGRIPQYYLNDLDTLLNKINTFDQSLDLKYDDSLKSLNCIAKEGVATLKFHIQTNGYWGYALAGDSIVDKVFGVKGGYLENIETQTQKGQFFNIDFGNGIHVLRDTDLQNPVLIMNDEEALLIDADNYGADIFEKYIKEAIGDRKLSVYITHQHGDHLMNLQYLKAANVEKVYYPAGEPLTGGTAGVAELEDCLGHFVDANKLVKVNDGDKFEVAGKEFEVIAMKGHTEGGTQLLDITDRVLFSGDTLGAQTYKGGTNVALSQVGLWKTEIEKNVERLKVNSDDCRIDYIIGGHTAYKNTPDYINWLYKCILETEEKGMESVTQAPTGNIVVVRENKVLSTNEIEDLFKNNISDEETTYFCSITVRDDTSEEITPPTDNADTSGTNTPDSGNLVIKTGDNSMVDLLLLTAILGASVFAIMKSRKKNLDNKV